MQGIHGMKSTLKGMILLMAVVFLFLYCLWFIFINPTPSYYRHCESYTRNMNGGIQTFQDQVYDIRLCGIRGRFDDSAARGDLVRLQVFSITGELLAERYFEPIMGMSSTLDLEYESDHLIYNDGEGQGYQKKMKIPPSQLDWILARLPRLWP